MSEKSSILSLWKMGVLSSWYCRPSQLRATKLIYKERFPFLECSRRWGKTTTVLCSVMEYLLRNPGWVARWCEPWKNQAREIVMPEIEKIQGHIPKEYRFKWSTIDSVYTAPNGSKLFLRGVNEDKGESARGPFANIIVADEYGSWKRAEYIRKDILMPQLLTTRGKFVFASTPPSDLGHSYYQHKVDAQKLGRFFQATIYDNESLTHEDIDEAKREAGGEASSTWRREYLCEPVADEEALVVPEFNQDTHVTEFERPDFFDAYVSADFGFQDKTGVLFAHLDFANATIHIEDELLLQSVNSKTVRDRVVAKELSLWGEHVTPALRVADATDQQLYDLLSLHELSFLKPRKDDKYAAINAMRLLFQNNKIKIHPRCLGLIHQLKVGMWNERRTDFERGEKIGHLDLIMALVYLNRMMNWSKNPTPKIPPGVSWGTHHINIDDTSDDARALRDAFGGKK